MGGFAAAFGHCYPLFPGFRGGKAVATMFGFLLSTSIFTFQSAWYLIVPFAVFLVVLYAGKMVSLSSMCAALTSSIYITVMQLHISVEIVAASWLLTILVIYRHRANIVKIKNGTENKISWLLSNKKNADRHTVLSYFRVFAKGRLQHYCIYQ